MEKCDEIPGVDIRNEMPIRDIKANTNAKIALAVLILEELTQAIEFCEGMGSEVTGEVGMGMTPIQRKVWEKYKTQTLQFAHDMMMVSGDIAELERRAGV